MGVDNLFSIGIAANMCGVSAKTLRYYESLDLIHPKHISSENGYRYYDEETLLLIPLIKYYRQVGLDLKRIKELISVAGCSAHYYHLKKRRDEITAEREELLVALSSVDDWLELIIEGELCLQNWKNQKETKTEQMISVKYYAEQPGYCYYEQPYRYNYKESIINLDWIRHLESHQLEVSGPVILKYDSYLKKMNGQSEFATILQHCFPESICSSVFGGFMALSCYHIGPLENITDTYEKIIGYAEKHKYNLKAECYERHVIDYWVTHNLDEFVTEIIIPVATPDEISF
ncbi:MerR family transcriptional regulator [Streptococcus suis]|uniref:MerR family transcriptional regulator n=1 Tax=Streptococcus suis TaxID=1307 RepID=A0A426T896_STRSU|nr:MerR family transcriptional regulator [Streptococcus suis]RRR50315.1 MerR family transcriptional regulator [Streptococcus suis]